MLRERFSDALKQAMRDKDTLALSTVRMILARLKERDIEVRPKGNADGIADPDIQQMMQGMIKQRRESIELYEKGKRADLAEKERGEIAIIERFLPQQMSAEEQEAAIKEVIAAIGAAGIKDMGRTMAALKERYAGRIDSAGASQIVKRLLG
ncbi:MAG TPA: GatB/YqeY domain-containing protein [Stellaceae bacterium]|nr:GatB/YqeY domain-containing protein [Stellaceae bacterium]